MRQYPNFDLFTPLQTFSFFSSFSIFNIIQVNILSVSLTRRSVLHSCSAPQDNGDMKENRSPNLSTKSVLGLCNLFTMANFGSWHKEPGMGFQFSSNCLSTSPNKNVHHSNFAVSDLYSAPVACVQGTFSPLPTLPPSSQISTAKFCHLNHRDNFGDE